MPPPILHAETEFAAALANYSHPRRWSPENLRRHRRYNRHWVSDCFKVGIHQGCRDS